MSLELAEGGDLFDRACMPGSKFSEADAIKVIRYASLYSLV
jgi:hypothetical protein